MRKELGLVGATLLLAGPAVAADLAVKAPVQAPTFMASPWDGFHIGGNVGPRVQINNSKVRSAVANKKYRARGIFLDNSYSDVLDLDIISKIMRNPDAQWLCDRFGYDY